MRIEFSDEEKGKIKAILERALPAGVAVDSSIFTYIFNTFKQGEEQKAEHFAKVLNILLSSENHADLALLIIEYFNKNIQLSDIFPVASSLIRLKEQGKSLSELKDFLEKNADPDKFLEVLPASVTPEEAPPVIKRDPILFTSPEHAKKREEIMGVLLTEWRSTIPGSDLVVVSFGSADDIKTGDAAQQREPEFVKEARNNGKIVSVLNIDSKFSASIVRHGQSTLDTPFRFRWDEQDCKNREIFNAFLNDLLKTTPVVLADYVGGHLKSLKKLIASGIDRESLEKLTLIGGWGCRLPVFLVKPSDMQIPDELPYYNQSGSLISTDQELKECNETRAIPFLILDRIPLSAIDEGLALTTKQSTAGAPSFADVRLFTTPPGKKGTDQGAEEKVEPKTPRQ